jgi:predicted metal-dependent phosphoesterase TrpH
MSVNLAQVSTSTELLRQVFHNIDAQSCPRLFNFHMHTVHSDGKLQPDDLMEQAIAIGLKGLAITDHHSILGYQVARDWLENWKWHHPGMTTPYLWSGMEINANLLETEVHILAYGFAPESPSLKPYLQKMPTIGTDYQANNVIAAVHQAGGIAILAHPARYKRSHFDLIPEAAAYQIDGVETFYAYNNPNPWKPSHPESSQMQKLADKYSLYSTCGTDTHGLSLLQRL